MRGFSAILWALVGASCGGRMHGGPAEPVSSDAGRVMDGDVALDGDAGAQIDGGVCGAPGPSSAVLVGCDAALCGTVLESTMSSLGSLAVDSTHLYWFDYGNATGADGGASIVAAPLDGGASMTLASTVPLSFGIAVSDANVYWLTSGAVMQVSLDGGPPSVLFAGNTLSALAVSSTGIYWTDTGGAQSTFTSPSTGSVNRLNPDGGMETLATAQAGPSGLALDATNVYWTNSGKPDNGVMGTVMTMPIAGGPTTVLATGPVVHGESLSPLAVAVDASSVYWVARGQGFIGAVAKVSRRGGCVTVLAEAQSPGSIAVDGSRVYWTDQGGQFPGGGGVYSIPIDGGPVTTLTPGPHGYYEPNYVIVDATHVFWTADTDEGAIGGTVVEF